MKKILYLTDLCYQAKGRNYCEEDIYITGQLKDKFDVVLCHPKCAESFEDDADLIVFRNTGGVSGFREIYDSFRTRVREKKLNTYNTFTGKADMCGKQYLLDLSKVDFPVIPTVDRLDKTARTPSDWSFCPKKHCCNGIFPTAKH